MIYEWCADKVSCLQVLGLGMFVGFLIGMFVMLLLVERYILNDNGFRKAKRIQRKRDRHLRRYHNLISEK